MALLNLFKDGVEAAEQFKKQGHVLEGEPDVVWTDTPGFRIVFLHCSRCDMDYTWDTEERILIVNHDAFATFEDSVLGDCPGPLTLSTT